MPPALAGGEYLPVSEVAKELHVSVATVRRWCDSRKLKFKVHPFNNYRFIARESVQAAKKKLAGFTGGQ